MTSQRPRFPPAHAFVDESRRKTSYQLTAVVVAVTDIQPVTRAVRAAVPRGQRRVHFTDERPATRRAVLDCYCRLPIQVALATATHESGNDQPARDACLESLVSGVSACGVRVLIMDTRGHEPDRRDRSRIARLIREGRAPSDLVYEHRGSRDEILLGLPDAIGWAYGADGKWRRQVEPLITARYSA